MSPKTMSPELERLKNEVAAAATGLTEEQLSWHPPGKWCAAEVLEHLYLTYTGTIKGFQRAQAAGKPVVTPATWRQLVGKVIVVGFGHMPGGRQAPAMARPRGLPREKVIAEIASKIEEMDETIRRSEQEHGVTTQLLDHPILGPLTGGQWRKFHLVHGRHHLRQIEALRQKLAGGTGAFGSS